jgi:hypothetical protein
LGCFLRALGLGNTMGVLGFWDYVEWNLDKENIKCYNPKKILINNLCANLRLIKKTIGLVFEYWTLEFI